MVKETTANARDWQLEEKNCKDSPITASLKYIKLSILNTTTTIVKEGHMHIIESTVAAIPIFEVSCTEQQ